MFRAKTLYLDGMDEPTIYLECEHCGTEWELADDEVVDLDHDCRKVLLTKQPLMSSSTLQSCPKTV